jgi:CBS domain-containing protein
MMNVSRVETHARIVSEVMVRHPKWLPADATIADVRALLADEHVHMALLLRDDRLIGTVTRADLAVRTGPDEPALTAARLQGRTIAPGTSLASLRSHMVARGQRRLAVVDNAGRLLGLLCLKQDRHGFCSDRDVASREEACRTSSCPRGPSTRQSR